MLGTLPVFNEVLLADAKEALRSQQTSFKNYVSREDEITAFIEFIAPPVSLVIVGAGNDVMPLVDMATIVGWDTTVVDGRPNYATTERFTSSCRVLVAKPNEVLDAISIDEQTVFVLMTHNYNYDKALLQVLIDKNVFYVGMLGPKKKLERMLNELKQEGVSLSKEQVSSIHSPVGLDIGAETPEEIALSIMAEIKAVLAGRQATSLKNKAEGIHPRSDTRIQEVKVNN
jgi:xanthine dehydrogenase accessory factor